MRNDSGRASVDTGRSTESLHLFAVRYELANGFLFLLDAAPLPPLSFDADQRSEPRHAPSEACDLGRSNHRADIFVRAGRFFGDAAH